MKISVISGSRADKPMLLSIYKELSRRDRLEVGWYDIISLGVGQIDASDAIEYLESVRPEYVLLLGDRWEIAAFCLLCIVRGVKIIHQGGGEVSQGAYDDIFRDWISRAATIHFCIDANCFNRMAGKGYRQNVYLSGSPRMDYIQDAVSVSRENVYGRYGLNPGDRTALCIYHPATAGEENPQELIDALKESGLQVIVIGGNLDNGSHYVNELFRGAFTAWYPTLEHADYIALLANVDLMIGNSSAGITEAISYRKPVVNVGDRQRGRDRMNNVIDCRCKKTAILEAIEQAMEPEFISRIDNNWMADGQASRRIADIVSRLAVDNGQ